LTRPGGAASLGVDLYEPLSHGLHHLAQHIGVSSDLGEFGQSDSWGGTRRFCREVKGSHFDHIRVIHDGHDLRSPFAEKLTPRGGSSPKTQGAPDGERMCLRPHDQTSPVGQINSVVVKGRESVLLHPWTLALIPNHRKRVNPYANFDQREHSLI
jgi:hypothetical protein